MLRVLSLNVTDGGTALQRPLLARLDELAPDLISLQEVHSSTVGRWRTMRLPATGSWSLTDCAPTPTSA